MYPRTGTTKAEVLNYYAQVAPMMLPHLVDRAVTRIRWPHGTGDKSFFEKNIPGGTPSWVRTVTVPTSGSRTKSGEEGELTFPIIDSLATLTWMVNLASLELHVHQWTVARNGRVAQPEPTGDRPRPGRAGRAGRVFPGRAAGSRPAGRGRPELRPGDQRIEGPAPVRRSRRQAHLRGGARLRQGDRRGARVEAAQAGGLADDQGPPRRQGVPRLVAEHRREDNHLAVLDARA